MKKHITTEWSLNKLWALLAICGIAGGYFLGENMFLYASLVLLSGFIFFVLAP